MYAIQDFERVDFKSGDIAARRDQVLYRLEFDVTLKFPLLIDGEGNAVEAGLEKAGSPQPAEESADVYGGEAAQAAHEL